MTHFIDSRIIRFFEISKGRNRGIVLVFGFMPARILKHRGWKNEIYRRAMLQIEIDFIQQCRRYPAYHYKDLSHLLADELNVLGKGETFDVESSILCSYFQTDMEQIIQLWNAE